MRAALGVENGGVKRPNQPYHRPLAQHWRWRARNRNAPSQHKNTAHATQCSQRPLLSALFTARPRDKTRQRAGKLTGRPECKKLMAFCSAVFKAEFGSAVCVPPTWPLLIGCQKHDSCLGEVWSPHLYADFFNGVNGLSSTFTHHSSHFN